MGCVERGLTRAWRPNGLFHIRGTVERRYSVVSREKLESKSGFYHAATKLLADQKLSHVKLTEYPLEGSTQVWPASKEPPEYQEMILTLDIVKTKSLDPRVRKYFNKDELTMLNNTRLPFLPSSYVKSPNFTPVSEETPFVKSKYDLKGVLAPILNTGVLNSYQYVFRSEYFNLKYIPDWHYLNAVKKSRPAMVVFQNSNLLFNKFQKSPIPTNILKTSWFPTRLAVHRRLQKIFYRDLFFEYLISGKNTMKDGILILSYNKIPRTDEERKIVRDTFNKVLPSIQSKHQNTKQPLANIRLLKSACSLFGLSFNKLFSRYF